MTAGMTAKKEDHYPPHIIPVKRVPAEQACLLASAKRAVGRYPERTQSGFPIRVGNAGYRSRSLTPDIAHPRHLNPAV